MAAVKNTDDAQDTQKAKMQRYNVDIPETLHRKIKIQAAKEGIKPNVLTARLFEDYLSKLQKRKYSSVLIRVNPGLNNLIE